MFCKQCGEETTKVSTVCPKCGAKTKEGFDNSGFTRNPKMWNILGWISFVSSIFTVIQYFFVDENYVEAPMWLVASILCWFYRDSIEKENRTERGIA